MNPLLALHDQGQSVWLDFITREFIQQGKLAALIKDDGLRGVTSNPTIFQKAFSSGREYDADIAAHFQKGEQAKDIFDALAIQDIQSACDAFRGVYDQSGQKDGFVSLEVSPLMARDTNATLQEARRLFALVKRPNVMIKIPATVEGLSAIEQALGDGININITLIFSLERYQTVMDAWLAGLERADRAGKPLKSIASVASFFISRVDTLVDGELEKKGNKALQGKAAIANAQKAYNMFEAVRSGARFKALAAKGAPVQRPLWASTSTKNKAYRDVIYVEELVGSDTVNTMPQATIDATRDHGVIRKSLPVDAAVPEKVLTDLKAAGVDMGVVTRQLEEEGLKSFAESYDSLVKTIEGKKQAVKAGA